MTSMRAMGVNRVLIAIVSAILQELTNLFGVLLKLMLEV